MVSAPSDGSATVLWRQDLWNRYTVIAANATIEHMNTAATRIAVRSTDVSLNTLRTKTIAAKIADSAEHLLQTKPAMTSSSSMKHQHLTQHSSMGAASGGKYMAAGIDNVPCATMMQTMLRETEPSKHGSGV